MNCNSPLARVADEFAKATNPIAQLSEKIHPLGGPKSYGDCLPVNEAEASSILGGRSELDPCDGASTG